MATTTRLSDTMITAMLDAIMFNNTDGRYQILGANPSTVRALVARGKAVVEEVPQHNTGRTLAYVYLTEEALTFLHNALQYVMSKPVEERSQVYRYNIARNVDAIAAFLLGDTDGVDTRTTNGYGGVPRVPHSSEDGAALLAEEIRNGKRLVFPDNQDVIRTHEYPVFTVFFPVRPVLDVADGRYRNMVGVLREDARDMGTVDADNVRAAIRNRGGHPVERLEDGTIRVGYSFFEPVAEEDVRTLFAPGEAVRVAPQHWDSFNGVYVPQPEFTGTVVGYTRNGCYKVREPEHGTTSDYDAARELFKITAPEYTFADRYRQEIFHADGSPSYIRPTLIEGDQARRITEHHRTTNVDHKPGGVIEVTTAATNVVGKRTVTLTPVSEAESRTGIEVADELIGKALAAGMTVEVDRHADSRLVQHTVTFGYPELEGIEGTALASCYDSDKVALFWSRRTDKGARARFTGTLWHQSTQTTKIKTLKFSVFLVESKISEMPKILADYGQPRQGDKAA
ncbi:hypothetical protein [Streptomyces sp. cg35]|uniref:hypothetical protein n=1 Tax=Streptomyces sp. cg35 TaxID=3421650 RepID=UPI003D162776